MKKAVLTFIFGADKEILREPIVVDDGVRYVCVTDQPLKSDVWEIRREYFPFVKSDRDKVALVKMQPFKYVDAEQVVTIDGSLQIKALLGRSVLKLMERLGDGQNKLITNQCALSYVIEQMAPHTLTYCIDQHKFFKRFFHNSFDENLT